MTPSFVPTKTAWEIVGYGITPGQALLGFRLSDGPFLSGIGFDGAFHGDVWIKNTLHFSDGSVMASAGLLSNLDGGVF